MRYWLIAAFVMTGCTHQAYGVTNSPGEGGVPFFPLESVDVKKAVYEQVWIEIRVDGHYKRAGAPSSAEAPAKKPAQKGDSQKRDDAKPADEDTFTRTVLGYTEDTKLALKLHKDFLNETSSLTKAWNVTAGEILKDGSAWRLFLPDQLSADAIEKKPFIAVERSRAQIPSTRPQYFQVNVPYGGSVSAGVELAPNGTLTKGSSQVDDKFPGIVTQTVGSVIAAALGSTSLNTVVSHFLAPAQAATPQSTNEPTLMKVDLKITTVRRLYTVTIVRPSELNESECGSISALLNPPPKAKEPAPPPVQPEDRPRRAQRAPVDPGDSGLCRATLAVEIQRGDDDKPKAKDEGDAINVSGTIKLPKASGDKPKEDTKK